MQVNICMGLRTLKYTNVISKKNANQTSSGQNKLGPSKDSCNFALKFIIGVCMSYNVDIIKNYLPSVKQGSDLDRALQTLENMELAQQTANSAIPKCPKCCDSSEVVDA